MCFPAKDEQTHLKHCTKSWFVCTSGCVYMSFSYIILHRAKSHWLAWHEAQWMCGNKQAVLEQRVCSTVTLSESKQAMTRPFSTWQLREGCANLHSASDREQVPLWNSRHTSKVSHLVSRPMVMLTAIRDARRRCAAAVGKLMENCLMRARVTNGDSRQKIPQHNTEETEAKIFSVSPQCK